MSERHLKRDPARQGVGEAGRRPLRPLPALGLWAIYNWTGRGGGVGTEGGGGGRREVQRLPRTLDREPGLPPSYPSRLLP